MTNNAIAYSPAPRMAPAAGQIIAKQNLNGTVYDSWKESFLQYVGAPRESATYKTYSKNLKQFWTWLQVGETGKEALREDSKTLIDPLPGHPISRPERADIIAYRDHLTAKGCKPNTVTGYLRSVKMFFKWLASESLYPDIAANVKGPRVDYSTHKKDALTVDAVAEIEASISTKAAARTAAAEDEYSPSKAQRSTEQGLRLEAMYLLAVNAGLRTIELHRANIEDYERKGDQAWLRVYGKGHTEADQKKYLVKEVAAALDAYIASRTDHPTGSSPLFVSTAYNARSTYRNHEKDNGGRIATTTISTMLKRAMQEAGYNSTRLTAHSLRHTAGTTAMDVTGNLYDTQNYMRHANPATTEIYLHNETEQRDAIIAQQIYNRYHGIKDQQAASSREKLEISARKLTPAQLEQLANIAAAMAG